MAWRIARTALDRVLALAAARPGLEVCGLLLADGDILPTGNVAADPADSFEIDPTTLFAALRRARAGAPAVVGCYHSHPAGPPRPSARDAAMALDVGQLWLILAGTDAALWRVAAPGRFEPVSLVVA